MNKRAFAKFMGVTTSVSTDVFPGVFALAKVKGNKAAIVEAEKLQLTGNHLYFSLLSHLHSIVDKAILRQHLEKALEVVNNERDRKLLQNRLVLMQVQNDLENYT